MANIRWSVICAAAKRKMRKSLDWDPFYEVAAKDLPVREKIAEYARIARQRFDADRFDDFCARHLSHLDQVAWEFFGTDLAKEAVRKKVEALFPAREVEEFTELFFDRIQAWRASAKQRPPQVPEPAVAVAGKPDGKPAARSKSKGAAKSKAKTKPVTP
jgi:hypothetical protein